MNHKIKKNNLQINTKWQFFLFLLVGGINAIFGYFIYALLIFLHLNYILAVLFSTILGVVFNFFTTGRLVFKNTNNIFFIKFALLYAALYFFNISIIMLSSSIIDNLYINGALATVMSSLISFFVNKYYIFKETP